MSQILWTRGTNRSVQTASVPFSLLRLCLLSKSFIPRFVLSRWEVSTRRKRRFVSRTSRSGQLLSRSSIHKFIANCVISNGHQPVASANRRSPPHRSSSSSKAKTIISNGKYSRLSVTRRKVFRSFSFICEQCQTMLRDDVFYSKDHSLFCQTCLTQREPCLMTLKSSSTASVDSQCKKCAKHFRPGESIAMYQSDVYHRDCFRCGHCAKVLVSEGFFRQEDGCLYCLVCHINHGPHCGICQEPFLTGEVLSQFDGKQFHHTCFLCETCQQPIDRKEFRYESARVICELCWKNTTKPSEWW